jgi:pectate lyase
MKNRKLQEAFLVYAFIFLACCTPKISISKLPPDNDIPIAFPGAEGFGKFTTGGRGGKVFVVSNLNDNGEGSLRDAVNNHKPKIVVFAISGTIHLLSPLSIKSNTTIAGQTAPGDGICLADQPVSLGGDNIIVRYMRFRMGDKNQNKGMVPCAGSDDAFSGMKRKNIIIDHCSMSWSTDEVLSVYAGDSTTLQWNLVSEPLNYSYHFETGDTDFEHHGYGGILGGRHISIHHNLYAHCVSRTPRFDGNRNLKPDMELADFRNNVIYNWGGNNVYGGEGGQYNIISNYYKQGPNTNKSTQYRIANPFKREPDLPFGKWHIANNYMLGSEDVTGNNWKGVLMDKGTDADAEVAMMKIPFNTVPVTTQSAQAAYELVLKKAGASYRRDTLDERIINDVRSKTGKIIDVQGGFPHGTAYEQTIGAWPALKKGVVPNDIDKDGMPDEWEEKNGLNKNNASDATSNKLHKHYANIEVYINSLVN